MNNVRSRSLMADTMVFIVAAIGSAVTGTAAISAWPSTGSVGEWLTALGVVSGLLGTYLCLVLLVMVARLPVVEREIGHDRLVAYHRRLAPVAVVLILVHVVSIVIGYAMLSQSSWWTELIDLVLHYPWMVPAAVSLALFILLSLSSIRFVKQLFRYETWWVAHTYFYLAIVLAIGHQLITGTFFTQHAELRYFWIGLYVVTAVIVISARVALPVWKNFRHQLVVDRCVEERDGVVSVYVRGRNIAALRAEGGQFFQWRFLTRHWWWQAHPYSLSAAPEGNMLRITVKDLGDQSGQLLALSPGTRVAVEGPYGVFTKDRALGNRVVCFAAGVGIAPVRALLEEFSSETDVTLLYRVSDVSDDGVANC